ncbi:hypothetical protein SPRG_05052 [Saprolegnia parasitica CBS 223.65]|uniref:RING-type domain-containing protein n=1 Tax=Saprolegnia parasitica (strain CBS 223.65) TaxID=695850 RepID=A0A067CUZ1_SAPPC|nr:hypothetical protein SPRG_05052 [Saprolegnia parasitica CBS 223.65]KDO30341.1 hypothetical protein SPRG_05052 [Saprolegnia parasitica CBS 223.65]|eukprot:XP_012198951.1 hypothetical protein SPRG_05052 [Saprolegnia parasitica CBS 223.65]
MATPVAAQQGPPPTAPSFVDVFHAREANLKGLVQHKNTEAEALRRQLIESNKEVERWKIQALAQERAIAEARSARRDADAVMGELHDDNGFDAHSPGPHDLDDRFDDVADEAHRYDHFEAEMEREDEQAAPAPDAFTSTRHDDNQDGQAHEAPMESGDDVSGVNSGFEFGAPEPRQLQVEGPRVALASNNNPGDIIPVRRVLYRHEMRNTQASPPRFPLSQPTARAPQREAPPAKGQPRAQRPRTDLIGIPDPDFARLSEEQRRAARAFSHFTRDPTSGVTLLSTNVAATLLAPIRLRSQGPVVHALPLPPLRRTKRRLNRLQFYRNKEMVDAFEAYKREELMTARRTSPQHYAAMREKFAEHFPAVTDFMWQFFATQTWPEHTALQLGYDLRRETCVVTLPCAHLFHNDCAKPWFARKDKCPQCKTLIVPTCDTLGKRP